MEFNKFHSAARGLGVSELLLPIVVIDAPDVFNEGSTDDIVLAAIERQYERIEEAVLTSRGSSEWKRTMAHIADRFASAYRAAEATLASLSLESLGSRESEETADEDLDAPGITELMESFTVDLATMTDAVNSLNPAMTEFAETAQSVHAPKEGATPKDVQLWSFRLATAIREPAEKINREGERLFEATKMLDEAITNLYRLSNDVPGMRSSIDETMVNFGDLSAVRDQLNSLLDSMKPAEALSVPLRKAIRPVRTGVTKVNDSIALIASWMPDQTK